MRTFRSLRRRTVALVAGGALAVASAALVTGDEIPWVAGETPDEATLGLETAAGAAGDGLTTAAAARAERGEAPAPAGLEAGAEVEVEGGAGEDVRNARSAPEALEAVAAYFAELVEANPNVPGFEIAGEAVSEAAENVAGNLENAQAGPAGAAGAENAPDELPEQATGAGAPERVPGPPEGIPGQP